MSVQLFDLRAAYSVYVTAVVVVVSRSPIGPSVSRESEWRLNCHGFDAHTASVVDSSRHEGLAILADRTPSRAVSVVLLDDWDDADPASVISAAGEAREELRLT